MAIVTTPTLGPQVNNAYIAPTGREVETAQADNSGSATFNTDSAGVGRTAPGEFDVNCQ